VVSDEPLLELLRELGARDFRFTVVTPATHARVLSRPFDGPPTLRDVFGWNRPFAPEQLDGRLLMLLEAADALEVLDGQLRSKVRVASLDHHLFLHSSFPTDERDSVFFGPDTCRFARFVTEQLARLGPPAWIVDMGAGSGAGGIIAGRLSGASRITLVDVNQSALRLSVINAANAGVAVEVAEALPAGADLVIANPPYMMDRDKRAYRDGGDLLGGAVALNWVEQALAGMAAGGTMLLYTGAAFERGTAPLIDALTSACMRAGARLSIDEIDPDVFGEELDSPAYANVERIAAIGAVIRR
jgi:methylase of polypeptide subunit release factors